MYPDPWSSPNGDETEEADAKAYLKMRVLVAGEVAGGNPPPHASGRQRCPPSLLPPWLAPA